MDTKKVKLSFRNAAVWIHLGHQMHWMDMILSATLKDEHPEVTPFDTPGFWPNDQVS